MKNGEFTKRLLKGKIAEYIFQGMFGESGNFTIIPFGYEYAFPIIAQHKQQPEIEALLKFIRRAPDFALINDKTKHVSLVEVKYRRVYSPRKFKELAEDILKNWDPALLFVATEKGFFISQCEKIIKNNGEMDPLPNELISEKLQKEYLKLMNDCLDNDSMKRK